MAMAPRGAGLISTAPTGGSAPSSLIAAAGYVLTRPAYPYRTLREPEERGDQKQTDESLVVELARLSPFEYDRKRKDTAKAIGITVSTLDKAVAEQRGHANAKDADLPHWNVEPWPEAVSGDRLLNDLATVFSRYVILPKHAADALALWVVHAWAFDAWDISPFMVLVSPDKRCGKTPILIILQFLTPRSEFASNISAAAVFR
jgi:putative DNA primase/helicase